MNKIHIAAFVLTMAPAQRALSLEVTVTPGSLARDMARLESTRDTEIKLKGAANVTDLSLLPRISDHVTTLDMSELTIAAYTYTTGGYKGRTQYGAGELVPEMLTGTQVTRVTLPASATRIGNNAFAHSRLTTVTIPANITAIDGYAFAGSKDLATVTIQGNPTYGPGIFVDCTSLHTLAAAHGIANVSESMFRNCRSLTVMPDVVKIVGAQSFRGSGLTAANLGGVSSVGDYAFAQMSALIDVSIGADTQFGNSVFYGDSGLQNISDWAATMSQAVAAHTGLTGPLTINTAVIEEGALANNRQLTSVTLGPAVTRVEANAFRNDSGLTHINVTALGANIPDTDPQAFAGLAGDNGKYPIKLTVLETTVDAWKATPVWQDFEITGVSGIISIDDTTINVTASRTGGSIHVRSSVPMTSVAIYDIQGLCHFTGGEDEYELTARIPTDKTAIVKVTAGKQIKVFKLR